MIRVRIVEDLRMAASASPDRPRVLMAVHSAERGGAQLVALGQARALRHECDLVIAVGSGPLRGAFADVGVAIVGGPVSLPIWGASRRRWTLQVARSIPDAVRLARLLRRHRIDVVVVNSTVLVSPVLAARLAGVPVIVHAQEAPTSPAARRLFRVHGALAHAVVAISPWIARAFAGARAGVVLIHVGIAVPADPGSRTLFRGDRTRLVVVGTVDRHKRQDVAVAAVRALRDQGLDVELSLLGVEADRAYAAELRAQVRDLDVAGVVDFAGPSSDVPGALLAADALLLPAGEVTPLVLMEAMALRTPVVAARMGSIPDVVTDGESGLLVEPDDPAGIAAAVARLRGEAGLPERLAEAGRRRVERDFDETRSHRRLAAEIARLTAGPKTGRRRRLGALWRRSRAAALRWRLRASRARVAAALVYHRTDVAPPSGQQIVPGITAAALEQHVRHLRRSYALVPASELHRAMLGRRRGRPIPIAITFDDDLASHLEVAAPLLRRLGCPATFFLTGAGLDDARGFWWQLLQTAADRDLDPRPALRTVSLDADAESLTGLAAEVEDAAPEIRAAAADALAQLVGEGAPAYHLTRLQVRELAQAGCEIGFHTRDHRPLPELSDGELSSALVDGRAALEEAAGRPVHVLAYPHGRADDRVAEAARRAGYTDGFGGAERITARSDRLLLGRTELLLEDPGAFELALAAELWRAR